MNKKKRSYEQTSFPFSKNTFPINVILFFFLNNYDKYDIKQKYLFLIILSGIRNVSLHRLFEPCQAWINGVNPIVYDIHPIVQRRPVTARKLSPNYPFNTFPTSPIHFLFLFLSLSIQTRMCVHWNIGRKRGSRHLLHGCLSKFRFRMSGRQMSMFLIVADANASILP